MSLDLTILGCGSSTGVPRLGGPDNAGDWGACDPNNPKNRRTRCSILARQKRGDGETAILVDTSPDLRTQLLAARCSKLDAAFITHDHADQTHGMDDLRTVAYLARKRVDVYSDKVALADLHRKFGYIFESPPGSGYPPICTARELTQPFAKFEIEGTGGAVSVTPFMQGHGSIHSVGYRIGNVAYSSDVNTLDDAAFAVMEGVECWIVDALRYQAHPSHSHVAQTLEWIARVKPRRAILTNLHIDLDYEALKRELPPGVEPAYDGMVISVQE